MNSIIIQNVNVGSESEFQFGDRRFQSGIDKQSVTAPVFIGELGLDGDVICDSRHHGGPDQAVYSYSVEDYDWWAREQRVKVRPGLFGENLTLSGLPGDLRVGDRLLIGDVILEATSPRIPCSTLAARLGDSSFGLRFRDAERPGTYFRVIQPGSIRAGDKAELDSAAATDVTMLELFRLSYKNCPDRAELKRVLQTPLAERMRVKFSTKPASAQASNP